MRRDITGTSPAPAPPPPAPAHPLGALQALRLRRRRRRMRRLQTRYRGPKWSVLLNDLRFPACGACCFGQAGRRPEAAGAHLLRARTTLAKDPARWVRLARRRLGVRDREGKFKSMMSRKELLERYRDSSKRIANARTAPSPSFFCILTPLCAQGQ